MKRLHPDDLQAGPAGAGASRLSVFAAWNAKEHEVDRDAPEVVGLR